MDVILFLFVADVLGFESFVVIIQLDHLIYLLSFIILPRNI